MKDVLVLLWLALFWARVAQAQNPVAMPALPGLTAAQLAGTRAVNEPRKFTFYEVAAHTLSETPVGDSPKIEFSFRDSVSGTVRRYYASGKLRHVISYAHIPRGLKHGVETTWSEEGKMLTRQEFQAGEAQGDFIAYFRDGGVERKIEYQRGHIVRVECFDRQGQPKNCIHEEVPPQYPGGVEGLAANLRKLLAYPPTDLQDGRTGDLFINFTVDTTGAIRDPQVSGSPSRQLYRIATGAEAWNKSGSGSSQAMYEAVLNALKAVRGFRKPGVQEGRIVPVVMYLEVHFDVKKPGKGTITVLTFEHGHFPPYTQQR